MFDFHERVVIVTGVSGNLGGAVARAFHASGAYLVLVDRGRGRIAQRMPEITGDASTLVIEEIDLTQKKDVEEMANQVIQHFGQIDVLANTVGGYRAGTPTHRTPQDDWEFLLTLNLRTALNLSQAVIPHMLTRNTGKIIHTAARAGLAGKANMSAYSVSKSAIIRLTESMAAELKTQGIHVNCILPGTIDTPQNRQAMPKADFTRWVSTGALADVFLFLASDAAGAIHGAAIPVYGLS